MRPAETCRSCSSPRSASRWTLFAGSSAAPTISSPSLISLSICSTASGRSSRTIGCAPHSGERSVSRSCSSAPSSRSPPKNSRSSICSSRPSRTPSVPTGSFKRAGRRSPRPRRSLRTTRPTSKGVRLLETKKMPVMDEQGQPQYLLGFSEDITERKTLEEQLHQAQKMEALGQLTGGLAHDFNNLLGIIIGNLDFLQDMLMENSEAGELLRDALDAGLRGAELNRHLLAFARRQPLQPKRVEINKLVTDMTKLLSRTLAEGIDITLSTKPDLWFVVADPAQLEAALTNLCVNARDAMPSGGRLTISTSNTQLEADYAAENPEVSPGEYVLLEVTDAGTGMPPEVVSRVFEPFFTTKATGK